MSISVVPNAGRGLTVQSLFFPQFKKTKQTLIVAETNADVPTPFRETATRI